VIHRAQLRALISDAYYNARNDGRTMEDAADTAVEDIMQRLAEEPGLTAIVTWGEESPVGIVAEHPQANPQHTPPETGSAAESCQSGAADTPLGPDLRPCRCMLMLSEDCRDRPGWMACRAGVGPRR